MSAGTLALFVQFVRLNPSIKPDDPVMQRVADAYAELDAYGEIDDSDVDTWNPTGLVWL